MATGVGTPEPKERRYCCLNTVLRVLKSACAVGRGFNKRTVVRAVDIKASSKKGPRSAGFIRFLPVLSVRAELTGVLELSSRR